MSKLSTSDRMINLFLAIGAYRRKKGFTQDELAEKVGISRQHLAAIESPKMDRGVSMELLFDIAAALEIEPYVLFKFGTEE